MNFNSDHFRNDICQHDWSNIENYSDPNLMWAAWKQLFLELMRKQACPTSCKTGSRLSHLGLHLT